jgi:filamentous hemagglutinin
LIANENGVGVRLNAPVAAQNGDMVLSAQGDVVFADASATENMQLASAGNITLAGRTVAGESMALTSEVLAIQAEQVSARHLAVNSGEIRVEEGSALYATEALSLNGDKLVNEGEIAGKELSLTVGSQIKNRGDILADEDMTVTADSVSNSGTIRAGESAEVQAEGQVVNSGEIVAGGNAVVESVFGSINNSGLVTAEEHLSISANTITNDSGGVFRAQEGMGITATASLSNAGNIVAKNLLDVDAKDITNERRSGAVNGDGVLGAEQVLQIQSETLRNQGGALIGSGNNMELLVSDALTNDSSSIQSLGSIYIGAGAPEMAEGLTEEEKEQAVDAAKNNKVRNDQGEIISMNGDITIFTRHLDNSREINLSKDYSVTAEDLLEANWLALQDDDPLNDIIKLMADNAEMSKDDWAFVFDPNVYAIPLYSSSASERQASVDYWLTQYTNYLNGSLGAGLSNYQVATIRKKLVGNKDLIENRMTSYYEYSGNSESSAINVGRAKNPLAETMWIISRVSQIIKDLDPQKYSQLLDKVKGRLVDHMGTLNVWQSACGEGRSDWRGGGESCDNNYVKYYQFSDDRYDDVIDPNSDNTPSLISSGNNLVIYGDVIDNRYSALTSVGDMHLEGDSLVNESFRLQRHFNVRWGWKRWHNYHHEPDHGWRPSSYNGYREKAVDLLDEDGNPTVINSVIAAGGNVTGSLEDKIENAERTRDDEGFDFDEDEYTGKDEADLEDDEAVNEGEPPEEYVDWGGSDIARVINTITSRTLELLERHNSLFSLNLDPNHPYLIETNPLFASLDGFLGSAYLIDRLGLTPNVTTKRLGDSYYETSLIRDAVIAATGTRFLDPDFESDQDQFSWLMDNAVASAESLELSVGVSLNSDQVNALQHDIVWMEEQNVAGHKVLVPVLYLAPGSANLTQEGSVISGNSIHLEADGVGNSGVIAAGQDMTVIAGDKGVVNSQGTMQSGGLMLVDSQGDIKNQSASIQGRDVVLQSQGSIINEVDAETIEETRGGDDYWRTEYGDASQIEGVGDVTLNAGEHIVVTGSRIAGENVGMQAAGNIQIESLAVREGFDGQHAGGDYQYSQVRQLASSIEATMNVMAIAGNSIGITASNITAGNNIKLSALEGDILIRAAANEDYENYHYEDSEEEKQITNHTVRQQQSALSAGGDLQLDAGGDLIAIAAKLQSGGGMSLSAGGDIALLAAQNSDYHLYESDKDGDYGAKSHKKDEIQNVTNVTTSLESGGDLSINSEGDQHYQAARLESGGDISIVSGGHITFESVKDLYRETHERSQGDLAWNKMSGEGQVDETLLQTAIVAQGNLAIDAAEGMTIDIKDMDQQSVSQLIDGMVANNPDLAWLKEADANGDVDWQRVQEMHDSWDYSSQSMGAASALVVAIVVTVLTAGAGAGAGAAVAGATGTGAAGVAATAAVVTGAATTSASALINNQGDLGATLDSLDHSETYQGLAVSGITAGFMTGVDYVFGGTTDSVNNITKGFDLNTPGGMAGFTLHNAAQAGVSAGVSSSIYGTSFSDAFEANLESQGNNVLSALAFNQVGNLTTNLYGGAKTDAMAALWKDGGLGHVGLHAVVGGAVTDATGGEFATGAAAAGLNQLLSTPLDGAASTGESSLFGGGYDAWRIAGAQLAGIAGAVAVDGDVNDGAWIAKQADTYNRQLHKEENAVIAALREGETTEDKRRLNAAACYLVRCAEGIPEGDSHKAGLVALQEEGAAYQAEQDQLEETGLFTYGKRDSVNDFLLKHEEAIQRVEGGMGVAGGIGTAVGGGSLAIGGCVASAGILCGFSIGGGSALIGLGYGQSVDGANTLFGDYSSSQGENVLASFGTNSYPGEQDPTLDLAWSAGGNLLLMGAGAGLTKGMMYLDDVASGFGVFGRGVSSSPEQFRFFEVSNNAVELPVTLHQQKELSLLTAQTRNDLANDFDLLINELTPNQIDAIAEHPWTMRLFFGSAVESRVAGQIDNLVLDNPSHVLSDLTWTRRTNAPQDFYTLDGYGFDITGNSPASIFKHQSRPEIDSLVTYDSIPNDLGYRFINWLENN